MRSTILSSNHLNLIVTAGLGGKPEYEMLLAQNMRSVGVCADYRNTGLAKSHSYAARPIDDIVRDAVDGMDRLMVFDVPASQMTSLRAVDNQTLIVKRVVQTLVLKACDCYDHNACDTNDYTQTDAAAFVMKVRAATDASRSFLYDSLPWFIERTDMKDTLQTFIERVANSAAREFAKHDAFGCMLYHAVKPDGEEVIFPLPPGDKDRSAALARQVLKSIDAVRVAMICEAWMLDARMPDVPSFDIAKIEREGVACQPGRIEVLLISGEDQAEGSLMARREIIRHDGRVMLGKLEFIEQGSHSEGRMVGMLPAKGVKH